MFNAPAQPHTPQAQALDHIANGGVAVYWRPGCPFCVRLVAGLSEDGHKVTWTNIWEDPDASEYVESLNQGNAVVPTVVTRETNFVASAPDAAEQVRDLLVNATLPDAH